MMACQRDPTWAFYSSVGHKLYDANLSLSQGTVVTFSLTRHHSEAALLMLSKSAHASHSVMMGIQASLLFQIML